MIISKLEVQQCQRSAQTIAELIGSESTLNIFRNDAGGLLRRIRPLNLLHLQRLHKHLHPLRRSLKRSIQVVFIQKAYTCQPNRTYTSEERGDAKGWRKSNAKNTATRTVSNSANGGKPLHSLQMNGNTQKGRTFVHRHERNSIFGLPVRRLLQHLQLRSSMYVLIDNSNTKTSLDSEGMQITLSGSHLERKADDWRISRCAKRETAPFVIQQNQTPVIPIHNTSTTYSASRTRHNHGKVLHKQPKTGQVGDPRRTRIPTHISRSNLHKRR